MRELDSCALLVSALLPLRRERRQAQDGIDVVRQRTAVGVDVVATRDVLHQQVRVTLLARARLVAGVLGRRHRQRHGRVGPKDVPDRRAGLRAVGPRRRRLLQREVCKRVDGVAAQQHLAVGRVDEADDGQRTPTRDVYDVGLVDESRATTRRREHAETSALQLVQALRRHRLEAGGVELLQRELTHVQAGHAGVLRGCEDSLLRRQLRLRAREGAEHRRGDDGTGRIGDLAAGADTDRDEAVLGEADAAHLLPQEDDPGRVGVGQVVGRHDLQLVDGIRRQSVERAVALEEGPGDLHGRALDPRRQEGVVTCERVRRAVLRPRRLRAAPSRARAARAAAVGVRSEPRRSASPMGTSAPGKSPESPPWSARVRCAEGLTAACDAGRPTSSPVSATPAVRATARRRGMEELQSRGIGRLHLRHCGRQTCLAARTVMSAPFGHDERVPEGDTVWLAGKRRTHDGPQLPAPPRADGYDDSCRPPAAREPDRRRRRNALDVRALFGRARRSSSRSAAGWVRQPRTWRRPTRVATYSPSTSTCKGLAGCCSESRTSG